MGIVLFLPTICLYLHLYHFSFYTMRDIMNEKLFISKSDPLIVRPYNYECFTYPWHFHSEYEIMYVEQSYGRCFVGDAIQEYRPGDIILFGSNLPHYMNSAAEFKAGNRDLRTKGIIIQFEKEFLSHAIAHYPQFLSIRFLLEESKRGILFRNSPEDKLQVRMWDILGKEGLDQLAAILFLLQDMAMSKEKKLLASSHYYDSFSPYGNNKIEKIVSYLNVRYTQPVSLPQIASMAAMNPAAFCRYFKEKTGKTLKQYINEMRIGYACKLLMGRDKNISEIAVECGFESITHFNRIFKRITGYTPSVYKEQILL